ncbi:MAG: DUF2203 family protein [Planctomycetota bacterium]
MRHVYTVESANRTLPYVRGIVSEIRERYRRLKEEGRRHNEVAHSESDERSHIRQDIQDQAGRLRACQEELQQIGVKLEDYELGLVDFPAELDGRPIVLCWQDGEDAIRHWHDVDASYLSRQPVPKGLPAWPGGATVSSPAPE